MGRPEVIPREPTPEECETNARIVIDGRSFVADWYPQMGGYVGKCLIEKVDGCFDVYVWHDGEFAFSGEGGRNPVELHHCSAEQFIAFGELLARIGDED